jgi:hypothetical protein
MSFNKDQFIKDKIAEFERKCLRDIPISSVDEKRGVSVEWKEDCWGVEELIKEMLNEAITLAVKSLKEYPYLLYVGRGKSTLIERKELLEKIDELLK